MGYGYLGFAGNENGKAVNRRAKVGRVWQENDLQRRGCLRDSGLVEAVSYKLDKRRTDKTIWQHRARITAQIRKERSGEDNKWQLDPNLEAVKA